LIRPSVLGVGIVFLACHCAAQRPSFEVVSIKTNHSGSLNGGLGPQGSRLVGTNVNLNTLLLYGYSPRGGRMLDAQILGEPNWARSERFDIEAKAEGDARIMPGEQTRAMVRSLLEDSFQLKARRETRDLPVYNLVLAKTGPKLSADQAPPDPRQASIGFATQGDPQSPLPRGALRMVNGPTATVLTGTAISVPNLIALLQSKSDRILIDKTGFAGLLDVQLTFVPDLAIDANALGTAADSAPSLLMAIQDIGLKLESAKAPLEVLVIDSVQRPPQN
jgi:uncharacterized protein (TIGR03435 family)